jgi:hypothetical protein
VLAAARGNYVYPAQQVKSELVAALGVEAAFREWREIAGLPADARLVRKPLLELHGAALARARTYLLQEPAGESVTVAPPRIIGPQNSHPLQARPRTRFVACFEGVQVRGRSSVIEFDDALLLDFEGDELASIDDNLDLDPAIFSADGEQAWTLPMVPDSEWLELDEAFQLSGTHTWAFGHWMWEYLPRYVDASMEPGLPVMPVLVDEEMPPQHLQALRALLAPGAGIVQLPRMAGASVHRLWTAPTPMYMPLYEQINERYRWDLLAAHPGRFALIAAEMNRRVDAAFDATPPPSAPRRVFLARKPERHRKMCNSPEIEALLHARGFETVYPEDLDFDAQVRMMRGAEWVVGPEGSAMFLAFFARPGTRICILNHPFTLGMTVLTSLLEALHLEVSMFTGPALTENKDLPHFIDYSIDAEALGRFVDAEARA